MRKKDGACQYLDYLNLCDCGRAGRIRSSRPNEVICSEPIFLVHFVTSMPQSCYRIYFFVAATKPIKLDFRNSFMKSVVEHFCMAVLFEMELRFESAAYTRGEKSYGPL